MSVQCNDLTQEGPHGARTCSRDLDFKPRGPEAGQIVKGVIMKKLAIKVGIIAGSALLGSTLISAPSQAMADTSWGCPGCRIAGR